MVLFQCHVTPWKINFLNLQITHVERKMIFQTSMITLPETDMAPENDGLQ